MFGLIACLDMDLVYNWTDIEKPWREAARLFIPSLLFLLLGLLPYIDNFSHLGGFVFGALMAMSFMPRTEYKHSRRDIVVKRVLSVCAPAIALILLASFLATFYSGGLLQRCPWCLYLDCVGSLCATN